jgi:hypothetical protein
MLIILQQTIGCSKIISIFKVKIFSLYTYLRKIQNCHKTKKLSKLGPLFMCSFGTQIRKIKAERTLFIPQIGKIEAKQSLFIPQIRKIEAKRTRLIPEGKIEAKQTNWIEVCLGSSCYVAEESIPRNQFPLANVA